MRGRTTTPEGTIDPASKLPALRQELERIGPLLVSYSGGVDSALLAVVAREVLGDRMACAFLDGPLIPRSAAAEARAIAEEHDLPLVVIPFDPLGVPAIAGNPPDRCYHCKKALAPLLKREAAARGLGAVVDGVNSSDFAEHRPGLWPLPRRALLIPMSPWGARRRRSGRSPGRSASPSRRSRPRPASRPASPTASPRPALLAMVEEAEEALRRSGFGQGRVRAHGRLARVEVPVADLDHALRQAPGLVAALKAAGFAYVTLDLEGYRAGAMDEVLGVMPK